ncbi:MAG: hypothetical protein ACOX5T_04920 [Candidatus Cryptobacteroides sp.]|jgi:hypothetical protein
MNQEVNNSLATAVYTAPNIEVIDIELTQNILQGSGNVDDFDGEDW